MLLFATTFSDILNYNLFSLGETSITPLRILYLILLTYGLFFVSGMFKNLLVGRILGQTSMPRGTRQAIGTVTRYIVLLIGFIVILQTVGIDLTALTLIGGAVGIGIGFGLQNIASNFISGLIILFERPIQVGDRIEANKVTGEVMAIGPRSTRIRTNDNVTIIIPNSKLVAENVVNWSYKNDMSRVRIPVTVDLESDIDKVKQLLIDAADENPDVETEPVPKVNMIKFDSAGIELELLVWSKERFHRPGALKSDLNYSIFEKFRSNKILVPTPDADAGTRTENSDLYLPEAETGEITKS